MLTDMQVWVLKSSFLILHLTVCIPRQAVPEHDTDTICIFELFILWAGYVSLNHYLLRSLTVNWNQSMYICITHMIINNIVITDTTAAIVTV